MKKNKRPFRILVTAGPTREWLDPVRFITNASTGVMGYEIARAARQAGCEVTLLTGPVSLSRPSGTRVLQFETTQELAGLLAREFPRHDILFMTAAVGDYTPVRVSSGIIKRQAGLEVAFKQTPDLLASLPKRTNSQTVVGFCLETENLIANALRKLKKKNLDFIVANFLGKGTMPFGSGETSVTLINRAGGAKAFNHLDKKTLARKLVKEIIHDHSK